MGSAILSSPQAVQEIPFSDKFWNRSSRPRESICRYIMAGKGSTYFGILLYDLIYLVLERLLLHKVL